MKSDLLIPLEKIEQNIFLIRGHKVMLDFHLAELYEIPTKSLNLAVKRNIKRFPEDFMFRLLQFEYEFVIKSLRFQFETSIALGKGGRRYMPHAFTEQGVAMLSSVLNSERAIKVNIEIIRAFVKLRGILASHKELSKKLIEMEKKYDSQFKIVFDTIRKLIAEEEKPKRPIGFRVEDKKGTYSVKRKIQRSR